MKLERLEEILKKENQPGFRLKQIKKAVFSDGILDFSEITVLSKDLREKLSQSVKILPFSAEEVNVSRDKKSIKALLRLRDNKLLETVLLASQGNNWSACVSSQVGCPLGCAFCATGKSGFIRNLTYEEIEGQILFWKNYLRKNKLAGELGNIVYMGMGEPFLNFEEVVKSIENLIDSEIFDFSSRSISVSTSGIMDNWMDFAEKFPQVNLALSLHSGDETKRSEIMPINKKFNLGEIKKVLQEYFKKHKRKVFIEYVMLKDFNDSIDDAKKLADFLRSVGNSYLLHVNLIRYNDTGDQWKSVSQENTEKFLEILKRNRIQGTIRQSLGGDIRGACGQLAGKGGRK